MTILDKQVCLFSSASIFCMCSSTINEKQINFNDELFYLYQITIWLASRRSVILMTSKSFGLIAPLCAFMSLQKARMTLMFGK